MGQDHLWHGAVNLQVVEDPTHREVVTPVGGIEVAQVELFLDFNFMVSPIEAGSEREILRSKSLLYYSKYPVGHLK